jgi:hypothetical protein
MLVFNEARSGRRDMEDAPMRKLRFAATVAATLALATAPAVHAGGPPRGLAPAAATILGHSLQDVAVSYMHWNIDSPSPQAACAPSSLDARIWLLPEVTSEGGPGDVECDVPAGSFLVVVPGFWECSSLEGEPFHAENEQQLIGCVEAGFEFIDTVSVTIDGRTSTNLDQYAVRTPVLNIPGDNLFGSDPGISMTKGYFAVMTPLHSGTHHARIDATYPEFDFEGVTDYTIVVR